MKFIFTVQCKFLQNYLTIVTLWNHLDHNIGKYFITIKENFYIHISGHIHTTCKTNSTLLICHLLTFTGDHSQLQSLKTISNKTVTVESLFDLSIFKLIKRFTTFGQFRASNLYGTFLRKYLHFLIFH